MDRIIKSMNLLNGKEYLVIVFLVFISCTPDNFNRPDSSYQKMVLQKVINDPSIQLSKDTLYLLESNNIPWTAGTTLNIAQKK